MGVAHGLPLDQVAESLAGPTDNIGRVPGVTHCLHDRDLQPGAIVYRQVSIDRPKPAGSEPSEGGGIVAEPWLTPLLDPANSPLDARQREIVAEVARAERAFILDLPSDDPLDPKRRFRVQATRAEMFDQPAAIIRSVSANTARIEEIAQRLARGVDRVYLVGAGDSLAVMQAARLALETMLGVPCEPVQSLEFGYFQAASATTRSMVVALSSSGETTRTVEAALVAGQRGAYTVGITNTAGSTLDRETDSTIVLSATRVGWPTQSSTTALTVLLELAVRAGLLRGAPQAAEWRETLDAMPSTMGAVLAGLDGPIAGIARQEVASTMVLFSGGGPSYAAAVVGAAKVKECTPVHALAIQVEEYHHYNSQKVGEPLFLLAPSGPTVSRAVDTGTDALRWGGRLYVVTSAGETAFDELAGVVLRIPPVPEALSPLLCLLPAQLVGYHLGMAGFAAAEQNLA